MSNDSTTAYFECACNSIQHLLKIEYLQEDNEIVLSFHLNSYLPWWKRLQLAIRYLFNPKDISGFGNYDCVILNKQRDCERIVAMLNRIHD